MVRSNGSCSPTISECHRFPTPELEELEGMDKVEKERLVVKTEEVDRYVESLVRVETFPVLY